MLTKSVLCVGVTSLASQFASRDSASNTLWWEGKGTARGSGEVAAEKVSEGWPVGTDPSAHIKVIEKLFQSGATMVNIHTGQEDQMRAINF